MHKLFKIITSKFFVAAVIILSQIIFGILTVIFLYNNYYTWRVIITVVGIVSTLNIINSENDNGFKIGWITLILIQPLTGTILYLMLGNARIPKPLRNLAKQEKNDKNIAYYHDDSEMLVDLKQNDPSYYRSFYYLSNTAGFPIYKNTKTKYLKTGEEKFQVMLEELNKAEKFILLEYFIVEDGKMWSAILDILKQKVKQGVEVFFMYDDMGCLNTLPPFYEEEMRSFGIRCQVFNPIRLTAAINMNYRNHRKLCIVDGRVAITGGINLADEYINYKKRFGHWRDSSVLLEGPAVWTFTLIYLRFFAYLDNSKIDYFKYQYKFDKSIDNGYIVPYADSPTDDQLVGHSSHMNMILTAKDYLYIQSPYIVLDQNMQNALILAAESGVDVRIMIPHIPDKKYVFHVTKHYCTILMRHGVKVYEYLPGFVHSKTFVSDDTCALVGSVNMDYRSYYLHYECGVYFYKNSVIKEVKDDFLNTLENCREISYAEYADVSLKEKLIRAILNLFSPIL